MHNLFGNHFASLSKIVDYEMMLIIASNMKGENRGQSGDSNLDHDPLGTILVFLARYFVSLSKCHGIYVNWSLLL
jgi:hypothetical protein